MSAPALPVTASLLNCRGRLLSLERPVVMGILNLTPDSFSDGGLHNTPDAALRHTERMVAEGAAILDIGGYSSRPNAEDISPEEEMRRVLPVLESLVQRFPEIFFSVDTFRAQVAAAALEAGAHIVNDISGGLLDPVMHETVARYPAPYVLMHMQGTPQTMQQNPVYADLIAEVYGYFIQRVNAARAAGVVDILIDPGFGFGKTLAHNFELLRCLGQFRALGLPILAGLSRKSMVTRALGIAREESLPATCALHLQALQAGARILRVHDVAPAVQMIRLHEHLNPA